MSAVYYHHVVFRVVFMVIGEIILLKLLVQSAAKVLSSIVLVYFDLVLYNI